MLLHAFVPNDKRKQLVVRKVWPFPDWTVGLACGMLYAAALTCGGATCLQLRPAALFSSFTAVICKQAFGLAQLTSQR
jgi:hypothetical protein